MQEQKTHNLIVKFYRRPWQNMYRTTMEGRPIFEDRDFVQIMIPGSSYTEIDTLAEEYHINSYPVEWARYQNALNSDDSKLDGTPLGQWSAILPSVAENLKYFKFFTVENIANASDQQLKAIENICGTSAFALRDQAKYYLESTKKTADAALIMAEREELKQQNLDMQTQMAQLMAQMNQMQEQMSKAKKRGPRKTIKTAVMQENNPE